MQVHHSEIDGRGEVTPEMCCVGCLSCRFTKMFVSFFHFIFVLAWLLFFSDWLPETYGYDELITEGWGAFSSILGTFLQSGYDSINPGK